MKKAEIVVGGTYTAKVSGKLVTVRVDAKRERFDFRDRSSTVYDVTNLSTGRKTTFRSATKFRAEVNRTQDWFCRSCGIYGDLAWASGHKELTGHQCVITATTPLYLKELANQD
jgi:hypothetical protein